MKEIILKQLVLNRTLNTSNDFVLWADVSDLEVLADKIEKAITVTPCCTELKAGNKKLSFKDWKYSKGMRYLSGHTYKDNDGDLYDSDELEKMYQNHISL